MAHEAVHPGEHLAQELEERCMSAAELARRLEMPTTRVVDILAGRSAIDDNIAFRLAHIFGTSAQSWLNLQNLYDLDQSKRRPGLS